MADCGHACCDERAEPFHDHFLTPEQCGPCKAPGLEWLIVLLTEVSAAIHGRGHLNALSEAVRQVPEVYLEAAGLHWALSSFDDQAPTAEAIDAARDLIGDPTPRLRLTPREDNPRAN